MFVQIGLEIVPQTVIQSKFARDLPGVLDEARQRMLAQASIGLQRGVTAVHAA